MLPRRKKSRAQLDHEIAETLARRRTRGAHRSKQHHATVQNGTTSDAWDVAMDALLEHDAARAADVVLDIKKGEGLASMTTAFSKALNKVPEDVRRRFEGWAGVVSKKSYDWSSFADGATNAF